VGIVTIGASMAAALGLLLWRATREAITMPTAAMEPTIALGAELVVDTAAYGHRGPRAGEVVAFHPAFDESAVLVLRIVAVGPAEVELLADGTLVVDHESAARTPIEDGTFEEKIGHRRHRIAWDPSEAPGNYPPPPWPVFDGKLFLLGDNRQDAHDSRYWGPIERSAIVGKVTHAVDARGMRHAVD
jgi:signal peptidase I